MEIVIIAVDCGELDKSGIGRTTSLPPYFYF
jgi:hypothetical protein